MKRTEFIKHIKMNYCCNESAEELISRVEQSDVNGDFIFENEFIVIGKYYYSLDLQNKCGEKETLHFCIFGLGIKHLDPHDDYELQSYENFEYIIL